MVGTVTKLWGCGEYGDKIVYNVILIQTDMAAAFNNNETK